MNDSVYFSVLENIKNDEIFNAFLKTNSTGDISDLYSFVGKLINRGYETDFIFYVEKLILADENAVALALAKRQNPSKYAISAYMNDLQKIWQLIKNFDAKGTFFKGHPSVLFDKDGNIANTYLNAVLFYEKYGFGQFAFYKAFSFENGEIIPVKSSPSIRLCDLKNYQNEKQTVCNNILNMLNNLPFEHMLLYGDRGTGKSSTVHAILNEYYESGLRLIEISKENLCELAKIRKAVLGVPLKFIIFIDDFSLSEYDDKVSSLKAALEGSVTSSSNNTMIVATSNRRHIVKESFSERENSIHARDSVEEQLSLSDRFGVTVMFSTTGKNDYLSIISQLASDKKLKTPESEIFALAERWALIKGGRSPRRAKQFIEIAYACEQRGVPIDF
ncbi:MAG: DUF815 domain-containing protein [Clostridiales bacterium]|nr:DUF815 domain-containing protein [Clostridiales bacterium]